MKILAMDSSGLVATVAVIEDDIMRGEYTINYKKTHSQTLLPMIDEVASMIELDLDSVDAIAVAGGPGSFTGLRIGSATAKGLGLALDKPIISVPTVVGLAYNYYGYGTWICPIMDARRNQVYTGVYRFEDGHLVTALEQCAISIDELIERLGTIVKKDETGGGESKVLFLGDGVPVQKEYIDSHMIFAHTYAPAHMNGQRAGALGYCAMEIWKRQKMTASSEKHSTEYESLADSAGLVDSITKGRIETAAVHHPDYLRLSQAERERAEKEKES